MTRKIIYPGVAHVIITGYPGNNKLSALAQQQGTNAALAANLVLV